MKKLFSFFTVTIAVITIIYVLKLNPVATMEKSGAFDECATRFGDELIEMMNHEDSVITVGGVSIEEFGYDFFVSKEMRLMVEGEFLRSLINCSVLMYNDGSVIIMKGDNEIKLHTGSDKATINNDEIIELGSNTRINNDKLFVPYDAIAPLLGYRVDYHFGMQWIDMARAGNEKKLPARYDMREYGRVSPVRDQGRYGTCWAFASLGALETTLLPREADIFSTDHMSMCNSYNLDLNWGGEHTMSIAYLAAWQGPVLEKDDPYGDGECNPGLKAVKHLEEALVINDRDLDVLKSAIFRYGAIETSLYSQMEYVDSVSAYFSQDNNAYYYDGEEIPNHDVVVVGWDDNFPRSKFTKEPEGDGAFICKNSWGEEFGEDGYFYVSYYDTNICNKSVIYTRIGDADNFDKIYQSDLLGWVGQMGFGKEEAFFSNVYKCGINEELSAVSFYATDKDTEFEVFYVPEFTDTTSFKNKVSVAEGSTKYAGYYTVNLKNPVRLADNSRYAVVVKIKTPGAIYPVAIEYNSDQRTENFDITDGEGYISLYGEVWHRAEDTQNCNVCLKAFTKIVDPNEEKIEGNTTEDDVETEAEDTTDTSHQEDAGKDDLNIDTREEE